MRFIIAISITLLLTSGATAQAVPADAAADPCSLPLEQHPDEADFMAFLDRLDAVVQRFVNGDADEFKDAWAHADDVTGDFGYVIQHEYVRREEAGEPYRQYRVTMLFRREAGEWKLFHRHADAQMEFHVPD